jgi:hypothetical protein
VTWAVREKSYSQRRACGLVGLHPKSYGMRQSGLAMKSFALDCENWLRSGGGSVIGVWV